MSPRKERTAPVSDALLVRLALAQHSEAFGDEAPRASGSRAYSLALRYNIPLPQFEILLSKAATTTHARLPWVERGTPDAQVNAMPYFFGILERMLAHPEDAVAAEAGRRRRLSRSRREVATFPTPPSVPAETDPVWGALLTELCGMVAPSVFTDRLLRTKVHARAEDRLEVEAEDMPKVHWLNQVMRRTLSVAQANLGLGDLKILFVPAEGKYNE